MQRVTKFLAMTGLSLLASCSETPHTADPDATPETAALYRNLYQTARQGFLFGHQDDTLYGIGWQGDAERSDVKSVCGDHPSLFGWEIGGLELGHELSIDSVDFGILREHIVAAYARNGVNTISWHPHNPATGGTSWDEADSTVVRRILPGGALHELFCEWLDRLGTFFNSLETPLGTRIPVLFRPFHEHTGSWFWWGKAHCTPEEYVALWHFTATYLRETCGVHNLLYVYAPDIVTSREEYLERYPGDEWVDVLGLDAYDRDSEKFLTFMPRLLAELTAMGAEKHKPCALTETGSEGVLNPGWWTHVLLSATEGADVAYVMVWRNAWNIPGHFYAPYPGHASVSDFLDFKNSPRTLFNRDIPTMYE